MKLITIIGARPQFIKSSVVSSALNKYKDVNHIIVHTGQHFDENMSDIFFRQMNIPKPVYNLNINGLNHGSMTGKMLEGIEEILLKENPDMVIVYGDTNSTLAGALAAVKLHIPIAHIEAGLRSFNMNMPEEINRILTDRISTLLFCPTETAIKNLYNEGYKNIGSKVINSGDVMYDAALKFSGEEFINEKLMKSIPEKFILATLHREENVKNEDNLKTLVNTLNELHENYLNVLAPLHPGTLKKIESLNLKIVFKVIPPVGYLEMIQLLKACNILITDSGGLQKEAFYFNKYCITVREQTEWVELVENNVNFIAGTCKEKIINYFKEISVKDFPNVPLLYGNGHASDIIAEEICKNI